MSTYYDKCTYGHQFKLELNENMEIKYNVLLRTQNSESVN